MKLNIYIDETFTDVREVKECERIKIPYRVAQYVVKLIPTLDLDDDQKVLSTLLQSEEYITAIVRATFGLKEEELAQVDALELTEAAKQIIGYVTSKMAELGVSVGGTAPNAQAPATTD